MRNREILTTDIGLGKHQSINASSEMITFVLKNSHSSLNDRIRARWVQLGHRTCV